MTSPSILHTRTVIAWPYSRAIWELTSSKVTWKRPRVEVSAWLRNTPNNKEYAASVQSVVPYFRKDKNGEGFLLTY